MSNATKNAGETPNIGVDASQVDSSDVEDVENSG